MTPAALAFAALMLLAVGGGALLWLAANSTQQRREAAMRARAGGEVFVDDTTIGVVDQSGGDPVTRWVAHRLWRSGATVSTGRVTVGLVVAALAFIVVCAVMGVVLGVLIAGFVCGVFYLVIARRAAARRQALLDQLPNYLDHLLRALSAGNTLEESIAEAAREASEPIRSVFQQVARQTRLGAPIADVLARQGDIHDMRDLNALAMAASVNKQYGGSMRRIIRSLIAAVRARDAAGRELRALTAESRFSAMVLVLISVGLTAYILLQNPQYYADMWASADTRALLLGSAGLQLAGIAVIYRMVQSTDRMGQ